MNNRNCLTADPRNIGGMDFIATGMLNHHKQLLKIKPTMKISEPRKHVGSAKKAYKELETYENVYKTFKAI